MASKDYTIIFTAQAGEDLDRIYEYWAHRGETKHGLQYAHDIALEAMRLLTNKKLTKNAKSLTRAGHPEVQELHVLDYSYSILYVVDNELLTIHVLRFWTSHKE